MYANQRPPRRDDAVDKVRTIFWFQYLGMSIGSLHPRAVQRAISPMPLTDALGGTIKNNKFWGYARGEHVPNAALVQRAAAIYPDSAYILNHVIWQILRNDNQTAVRSRQWVAQLDPDVQKVLIKQRNELTESERTIDMLERRFSLDSLAALTILFRLNHEDENVKDDGKGPESFRAWMYACSIFRMLMMIGSQFVTDEVKNNVFDLFGQRVFSLATNFWGARFDFDNFDFAQMSSHLHAAADFDGIYMRPPLSRKDRYRIVELIQIPAILTREA